MSDLRSWERELERTEFGKLPTLGLAGPPPRRVKIESPERELIQQEWYRLQAVEDQLRAQREGFQRRRLLHYAVLLLSWAAALYTVAAVGQHYAEMMR